MKKSENFRFKGFSSFYKWISLAAWLCVQSHLSYACADYYLSCGESIQGYTWDFANRLGYSDYANCLNFNADFNASDVIVELYGRGGDVVRLEMGAGIDLDLFLFNNCPTAGGSFSGSGVTCIGSSFESSGPEEIVLPYDGFFFVVIDGWRPSEEGFYDLSLQCFSSECSDHSLICGERIQGYTWDYANRLSYSDYAGCLNFPYEFNARDVIVEVSGKAGDIIRLEMGSGIDLDLFLFNDCPQGGGGGSLTSSRTSCIGASTAASGPEEITLPYDGVFYAVIDGWNSAQEGYFDLTMYCSVDCFGIPELECGETVTHWTGCGPYPPNGGFYICTDEITHLECSPKEYTMYHKEYSFTASTSGTYTFTLSGLEDDTDLFLFYDYCGVTTYYLQCGEYSINQGTTSETIQVQLSAGQTVYLLVDGPEVSRFDLSVSCGLDPCRDCWNCFYFGRKSNDDRVFSLNSSYCFTGMPTENQERIQNEARYEWSIAGSQVEYLENTNSTSQHPVMRFPGAGTYTVCMKIFQMNTNTLLYECCQRIIVRGTCTATPAAHFTYTYNASDQSFSLNAGTSVGGDHVLWDFYSEENNLPVTVLEGNKTSLTTKIVIPEFRCKDVCLSVSNGCGMSVYCVTLCRSNTNCQGNTPLYTLGGPVSPVINDRTLSFPTFPSAPAGTNVTFAWDFGDGGTSQARNPQYTYGSYGYYRVCLIIRVDCKKICYCWNIHVNPCPPAFEPHGGMLRVQFNGNENSLQYTIQSQNIQIASNQPWLVDNFAVNGSQGNPSLILALPQDRDYVICIPYLKNNGCLAYKCITVRGGNPFSCQNIVTRFTQNTGYQFSLPAGSSDISWTVDETGQSLGSDISSQYLPPVIPCTWRTISVRYFDGFRYRICCIRVFICLPDDCFTNIYYGDSGNQAHFRLEESGATDITWYFDDAPANILGSSNQVTLPYPGTCTTRWISVRFRDALGRWKICCRLVYLCNPFQCSSIRPVYSENNGYQFELDQNYSNIQWFVDETGQQLGNSVQSTYLPLPVGACGFRTISVRYRHPSGHWVLCCLRFWWCNPSVCQDQISVVKSGNNHVLSTSASYQQVSWYLGNQFLGSGNNFTASLPVNGSHKIYVRYFNPSNQSWYWCCSLYTPGGNVVCDVYNVLFREDFKSGPPAGYGYNQGDRIDKNVTWWKGDGTVTGEAGWVTSGKNLALTFHKNTLGIPRVKVQFDMIIPWYRNLMNGTYSIGLNGGFSLNSDFQSYSYTLTNMVQNQPGLLQVCNGGADILYCTHKTEVIADKNGLVEVYIDGKKVNHVFTITGNQVTNINFYGDITIDNVEIGECRLSNPFRDVIVDIQDQICGPANTEVLVPVSVRNYRNISGIQLKIASGDPSVAEITGFANINPNSGITPLDFAVVDKKLVLTYAFSPYSLNDDDKLFDIKVMLKSQSPAVVGLFFEGDLKALDVNGGSLNVTGLGGSVCVSQANLSVAGRIATSKDKGIQNVTVTGGIQNVFTGANGLYQVPQLSVGSSYNIKPEFDEALASGVDISDLFVLRRHMQGLSLFNSPYTYMAADMNTDKVIDISDLFLLRRIMQGLTTQLPNGLKAWRFVPKSYSFPAGNPLSVTIPESLAFNPLQQNQSNQDFVGVKFGDLDHSRISLISDKTPNRNNADVEFSFENRTAPSGTTIELALSCKNLSKAAVMQFSVQWPTDKLELIGLPSGNHIQIPGTTLFDETVRSSGKLGIIWETDNFATGTTLADGTVIYTFTFRLIGQNNSTAIVENSVEPKTAKLLTVDGAEVPLKVNAGTVQIALTSATEKTEERPLIIRPNPTNGRVFLDTSLTGIHKATIYSMTGQEHTVTVDPQGIDLSAFPAGVYLIQIHFEGKLYIGKVVKI